MSTVVNISVLRVKILIMSIAMLGFLFFIHKRKYEHAEGEMRIKIVSLAYSVENRANKFRIS